ncbi:Ubiquitin receptor RAD23 [Heracleum sosnowskyi]|uniref:Ubiquitin receptor RAD23 n=1 Tax=Heracleum sosnowskyi TaxID=360622 RepID=A0AAD8M2Q5_9APIA|nr:Ubiquitin receptor RAD23 [Heracleum sosnowskyi]
MWTSFDVRYFGIPSFGKTTLLLALTGKLNSSLKGIPEQAVAPIVAQAPAGGQAVAPVVAQAPAGGQAVNPPSQPHAPQTTVPHGGPNANPLNLFPQGLPNMRSNASVGNLDFLRNSPHFQALRTMVQTNPQILQPKDEQMHNTPDLPRYLRYDADSHFIDGLATLNCPDETRCNSS